MDTGSGKAKKERIAAEPFRAWERDRILGRCPKPAAGTLTASYKAMRRELATGRTGIVLIARLGNDLRVEIDEDLVVLKDGAAVRRDGSAWKALDDNWRVHLERLRDLHPILAKPTLHTVLASSLLDGGHFVEGRLANVLALPDEGKRAVLFDDQTGEPIGCRFRSPELKETVEYRLSRADSRIIVRIAGKDTFDEQLVPGELKVTPELFEVGK